MARLNVNISDDSYLELQKLAEKSGSNMTDFVKTALSLARLAFEESQQNNNLTITDKKGKVLKQVVLPR